MSPEYSAPGAASVVVVPETGSTQRDLVALAGDAEGWPHLSGIRAERQTAGRGRSGRRWDTQELSAMTASLVLRPQAPREQWTWMPLVVGVAVTRAVAASGLPVGVKWPNDVVVGGFEPTPGWGSARKVAGVLAEVLPDGSGVVVGIGVNLDGVPPVPWAATLAQLGVEVGASDLLDLVRSELGVLLAGDQAGWPTAVSEVCTSLGAQVLVEMPAGGRVEGRAVGLDAHGGLVVEDPRGARTVVVAGDVVHLRAGGGA